VVGLIAAYIGAQTTLRATKEAHKNNLELQKQNQKAMLRGVVQAIYAELTSLWDIYHGEFGDDLENLKPGEAFGTYYPLTQDYFTIYSSNSVFIGQLPDPELRHGIVKAYLKAKALIDSHLLNNTLLDELNRHQNADAAALDPFQAAVIAKASDDLKGYGDSVRTTYLETKTAVFHVLELIEESGMLDPKTQARLKSSSRTPP
jgi:hypothetical protein